MSTHADTKSKTIAAFAVLMVIAIFNAIHVYRFRKLNTMLSGDIVDEMNFSYEGNDFPNRLSLHVRPAVMVFNTTERYGIHAPHDWDSLLPRHGGWVTLGPDSRGFAVSMYHQFHCLNAMRYDLTQSKIGVEITDKRLAHAHHCYNFIRQALLCGSDPTLEPSTQMVALEMEQSSGALTDGDGVSHVCKDWVQVREYMEANQAQHPQAW